MDFLDILAIVVEVLSWVGLAAGIPLFVVALILRAVDGSWHEVDIEIVDRANGARSANGAASAPGTNGPTGTGATHVVRWFADDELRERELTADERHAIADPDSATAYAGRNGRLRFEKHGALARVFWVLSLVLLGVGVVALAGTFVLMFFMS